MSVIQKMFACSSLMLIFIFVLAQSTPVPISEDEHPEYSQFVSAQVMQSSGDPVSVEVMDSAVRPIRSASPFFGILTGYERPYKSHKHHQHHHYQEEHEPEYHRPHYHHQEHELQYHHRPQQNHGGGAGSYASAGSFAGGHGGGHSQSSANSQSASFGFGPFQASYSASAAHSGSHSNNGGLFDY